MHLTENSYDTCESVSLSADRCSRAEIPFRWSHDLTSGTGCRASAATTALDLSCIIHPAITSGQVSYQLAGIDLMEEGVASPAQFSARVVIGRSERGEEGRKERALNLASNSLACGEWMLSAC